MFTTLVFNALMAGVGAAAWAAGFCVTFYVALVLGLFFIAATQAAAMCVLCAVVPHLPTWLLDRLHVGLLAYRQRTSAAETPDYCPHNEDWDFCPDCRH